jgi:hypothetical protein
MDVTFLQMQVVQQVLHTAAPSLTACHATEPSSCSSSYSGESGENLLLGPAFLSICSSKCEIRHSI